MREYLMDLPLTKRENCIIFLRNMTSYDLGPKKSSDDKKRLDVDSMPDYQLIAVTRRIKSDTNKYLEQIIEYEKELGVQPPHTREELLTLNYNELKDIRNPLKSKLVKRSKVKKIEPAPLSTVEEGRDAIKEDQTDYFDNEDIIFITPQEAYMMFGKEYEAYSEEELFNLGFKLELGPNPIVHEETVSKRALKKEIIKFILKITDRYTRYELNKKSLEELKLIYKTLEEEFTHVPSVEEITHQLRLGNKS